MRILFLAHNGRPYGANKSLLSLMKYLRTSNDVLAIFPMKNHLSQDFTEAGVAYRCLPYFATVFFFRRKLKYLLFPFLQVLNVLSFPFLLYRAFKFKPDIVYSNSSMENMGFFISKALRVKYVLHVREFGDLDYDFVSFIGQSMKMRVLLSSDGLIFNSKAVKSHVLKGSQTPLNAQVVYNGIFCRHTNLEVSKSVGTRLDFGLVGYVHPSKGQFEAISYMVPFLQENPGWVVRVFGDGERDYIDRIKELARRSGVLDRVVFCGFIKDSSEIYSKIDVFLMFSKFEAFGRVTIEAMCAGIPVLGYRGGGTIEIIDDGVDGFLFDSQEEFNDKLKRLHKTEGLFQMLSVNASKKVQKKFSVSNYCYSIENFCHALLDDNCAS